LSLILIYEKTTLCGAGEHTELRMNDNNDPEPNSLNSY
jgi:hypothetical protein